MILKIKYTLFLLSLFRDEGILARAYLCVRMLIFPMDFLERIREYLERASGVLDIGCGYGVGSFYPSFLGISARICGIDFDAGRIQKLSEVSRVHGFSGLQFMVRDLIREGFDGLEWYDTALLIDVLHHIDAKTQGDLLSFLSDHTKCLLIKDIDTTPRYKYLWNYFHDRYLMQNEVLCFQWSGTISHILQGLWYRVTYAPIPSIFPYPHFLLIAIKD